MDPETIDGHFLGCSHERFTTSARSVHALMDNHPLYHPRQKYGVRCQRKLQPLLLSRLLPRSTTPTRKSRLLSATWKGLHRVALTYSVNCRGMARTLLARPQLSSLTSRMTRWSSYKNERRPGQVRPHRKLGPLVAPRTRPQRKLGPPRRALVS